MLVADESLIVGPQAGRVLTFKVASPAGEVVVRTTIKIEGGQTSGAFFVHEAVIPPGGLVPPHRHEQHDEVAYVVEGTLGALVGEREFEAGAGSFVIRPRGLPHALWNAGDRLVRCMDIITPATMLAGFEELDRRFSSTPATFEQLIESWRPHDTIWLPELAPPLVRKYKLRM